MDNIVPGTTQLSIGAARDEGGITLRTFRLGSPVARVSAEGVIRSAGTRLSLSAALDDGTLVLPGLTGAHSLSLDAEGDGEAWTIRSALTGPTLSGRVDGRVADLQTAPAFDGTVTLNAASLAPLAQPAGLPDLRGAATLSLEGNVTADLSRFDVRVSGTGTDLATGLPALDPLLAGDATLALDAARPEGGAITIRSLSATTATLALDGAGTLSGLPATLIPPPPGLLDAEPAPAFDGRLSLRATDLAPAAGLVGIPALAGSVTAALQGSATADLSRFDLRLTLEENGLALGRPDLDRVFARGLSVTLDAAREDDGPLTLRTLSLTSPDLSANVQGTVTGLPADLRDHRRRRACRCHRRRAPLPRRPRPRAPRPRRGLPRPRGKGAGHRLRHGRRRPLPLRPEPRRGGTGSDARPPRSRPAPLRRPHRHAPRGT